MILKCENCGFECASEKIMETHKVREALGILESKQKFLIRRWGVDWEKHIDD